MAGLQAAVAAQLSFGATFSSSSFQAGVQSRTSVRAHVPASVCGVRAELRFVEKTGDRKRIVRVKSSGKSGAGGDSGSTAPPAPKKVSLLCENCEGNGAVACSQCNGTGVNSEDHFNGRFKAGQTCWLCRGKREMLCGTCNGAGFMGGFMNTQDE